MVVRLLRHRRRLLTPQPIQRPRLDQSSRFLWSGCSWPFLPRRRGARLLATATAPAKLSVQLTAAPAGKELFGPAPLRLLDSALSQAAISSPLAVPVGAARSAT